MKISDIAIVVFTYGRLEHTKITLDALSSNENFEQYPVFIYSDGPKAGHEEKVKSVRIFLKEFKEKHSNIKVIERKNNIGLEKSIVSGITEILRRYPAVIVIEDDIRTSKVFLKYMSRMLNLYADNKKIGSVTGFCYSQDRMKIPKDYQYDIYFAPRTCSWGWATWRDRWDDIDWDVKDINEFIKDKGRQREFNKGGNDLSKMLIAQAKKGIDTWDIQWCYHNFKYNRFTIYPTVSYVENIGMDGTGVHCGRTSGFRNDSLNERLPKRIPKGFNMDAQILKNFKKSTNFTLKMFIELSIYRLYKIIQSIL